MGPILTLGTDTFLSCFADELPLKIAYQFQNFNWAQTHFCHALQMSYLFFLLLCVADNYTLLYRTSLPVPFHR